MVLTAGDIVDEDAEVQFCPLGAWGLSWRRLKLLNVINFIGPSSPFSLFVCIR